MSFEILDRDLMGRIGRVATKSGTVETPLLLPVVNPAIRLILPREMWKRLGCRALITNAYLMRNNFGDEAIEKGVHAFLDFPGIVATDSGAYQILVYKEIDATPEEIARFEEEISTDIAVILDVPTGWMAKRGAAEWTVEETLRRASSTLSALTREDILWMGPIQGGNHLDLVAHSARETGKMPFHIFALGSPTRVMEQYVFDFLVEMIMAAKKNLPVDKPFHLFGAGHPFMFAYAVALGCDMFDSAAYAIYARQQRYMTEHGTIRLKNLEYFPCACEACARSSPREVRAMPPRERERFLALHNLGACLSEIKRVKQAIREGRLWELLELRSRSHPSLLQALKHMRKHGEYLEEFSPTSKERGIFYFGSTGLGRPEIVRHRRRMRERYAPPEGSGTLVLLPQPKSKPFHRSREYRRIGRLIQEKIGNAVADVHLCTYVVPFGVVPLEVDDVYPLSQFEASSPPDTETIDYVMREIEDYIIRNRYRAVILHSDSKIFGEKILEITKKACMRAGAELVVSSVEDVWGRRGVEVLLASILTTIRRNDLT